MRRLIRSPLVAVFVGWSLYGFVLIAQSILWWLAVDRRPPLWYAPIVYAFVIVWTWALMTPAIMALTRRFPVTARSVGSWGVHAAAALAVTVITAAVETGIGRILLLGAGADIRFVLTYVERFDVSFFFYAGTVAFTLALDQARLARERQVRAALLEGELSHAQLRELRMHLQPHFLFNALNTVSALLQTDPAAADRILTRLGELLRFTLEDRHSSEATLQRELEMVRRYTEIEQIRFSEWLHVDLDVATEVLDARVPGMLLQPLIENAIKHGIAPLGRPGRILVRAERVSDELVLTVQDDGVGLPASDTVRIGIGLGATVDRLKRLYGDRHSLCVARGDPSGTVVKLRIPFTTGEAASVPSGQPMRF